MSKLERVKELLNERSANYEVVSDTCVDVTEDAQIVEYRKGVFGVQMRNLTPEQAVEATLGRGTCHIETEESGFLTFMNVQREHTCGHCGTAFSLWYYTEDGDECDEKPRFCPRCGREVVDE